MNRKKIALLALLLAPKLAIAAPITSPWIAPGGGISGSSKMLAPGSTLDGEDLTKWGAAIDANTTAATAAQNTASAAIPMKQKGAASGVASLDSNGNVTSPLNTLGAMSTEHNDARYFPYSDISQATSPSVTVGSNNGYSPLESNITMIGGHSYGDSQRTFIYGTPYGGNMMAVLLTLGMHQKALGGLQPALAPTGTDIAGGISSYPEMDAAAMYVYAGQNSPYVMAGVDITSSDNQTHAVTYDSTHAYFSPSLPARDVALIKQGAHVMTNSIGSNRTNTKNYWQPNNDYGGEVQSVATDGSSITVGGWRVLGAGNTDSSQVPSSTTLDTSTWPYTHPAIFIGVYTHAIDANWQCYLRPNTAQTSGGDANGPYGTDGGMPINDCEIAEMDTGSSLPDYQGLAKGILVTYNGPNKAALNSYDFMASGTVPNGYIAWNGSQANNFLSDGFYAHGPNSVNSGVDSATGDMTGAVGDTAEMAEFIGSSASQADGTGSGDKMSIALWEQILQASSNMAANPGANTSLHIGGTINGTDTDVSKPLGGRKIKLSQLIGELVFNSDGTGGVALHGATSGSGLTVDSSGDTRTDGSVFLGSTKTLFFSTPSSVYGTYISNGTDGNLSIGTQVSGGGGLSIPGALTPSGGVSGNLHLNTAGAQLSLMPSSGSIAPFAYATDKANISFSNAEGDGIVLNSYGVDASTATIGSLTVTGSLVVPFGTPASATAACTKGQLEMDATYLYSCVATNTWLRTSNGATW